MRELQAQVVNNTLKDELVESRELRNKLIVNETVFEDSRVKALTSFLLPKDFGATTEQVANYFEVGSISAIKSLVHDNKDELVENGLRNATKEELSSLKELGCISKNTSSITLFSRRGILNIAMLLRDSQVAKTIRSVLLDATESKTVVKEIINQQAPQCMEDILIAQLQEMKAVKQQLNQVNHNALEAKAQSQKVKQEIEDMKDSMPLFKVECDELVSMVKKKATHILGGYKSNAYNDKSVLQRVYQDIYAQIKREFGIDKCSGIKRKDFSIAKHIIEEYKAPMVLIQDINLLNSQTSLFDKSK